MEILGLTKSILQNLEPTTSIDSNGVLRYYVSHEDWYHEAIINAIEFRHQCDMRETTCWPSELGASDALTLAEEDS